MHEPISQEEALAFLRSVSSCPQGMDYGVVFKEFGEIDWIFVKDKARARNLAKQTDGQAFARRMVEELTPIGDDDDA